MDSQKQEIQERIDIIQEMLLSGLRRGQIIQAVNSDPKLSWGVGDRTIDGYARKAQVQITKQFEKQRNKMIPDIYAKYNLLYKRMMAVKDYRGAMAALDRMTDFVHLIERLGNKATIGEAELLNLRPTQVMFVVNQPKQSVSSTEGEEIPFQETN